MAEQSTSDHSLWLRKAFLFALHFHGLLAYRCTQWWHLAGWEELQMSRSKQAEDMIINVGAPIARSKSAIHTPLVFDDPMRFQRSYWMNQVDFSLLQNLPIKSRVFKGGGRQRKSSARRIRKAWSDYETNVDYGIVPMDYQRLLPALMLGLKLSCTTYLFETTPLIPTCLTFIGDY